MKLLSLLRKERADFASEGRTLAEAMSADGYVENADDVTKLEDLKVKVEDLDKEIDKAIDDDDRARPFASRNDADTTEYIAPGTVKDHEAEGLWGFDGLIDFARAVRVAGGGDSEAVNRLNAAAHQEGGSTTGDSFMVPPTISGRIFELVNEQTDFAGLTTQEVTTRNQISSLVDDTTAYSSEGIQAGWRDELEQMTGSNLKTETEDLKLNQLFAFATASEELIEDAPLLNGRLERGASRAIAWKWDEGIFRGDGVGKPQGFLNGTSLVTQAKESGQAADTIVAANVLKMYTRMVTSSINNAIWIANPDIMPQLSEMEIGNHPAYQPPGALAAAPHGVLLGRPLIYTQHSNTLGDVGDLVFSDLEGYHTATKGDGIRFATSIHLKFDFNEGAFRWIMRVGGQPILDDVVAAQFGSNTMSHFVALAERA